jgi:DnaK suppressor protein
MDNANQELFRRKIEVLLEELKTALATGQDATAPVQLDTSIGRLSRMDAIQSQQMALALKQRQRDQVQRLERALGRIEDGVFGRCRRCKTEIAHERLEAQPDAMLCVDCAGKLGG